GPAGPLGHAGEVAGLVHRVRAAPGGLDVDRPDHVRAMELAEQPLHGPVRPGQLVVAQVVGVDGALLGEPRVRVPRWLGHVVVRIDDRDRAVDVRLPAAGLTERGGLAHHITIPPSTLTTWPVM